MNKQQWVKISAKQRKDYEERLWKSYDLVTLKRLKKESEELIEKADKEIERRNNIKHYYPSIFPFVFFIMGSMYQLFTSIFIIWWQSAIVLITTMLIYYFAHKLFYYELNGWKKEDGV